MPEAGSRQGGTRALKRTHTHLQVMTTRRLTGPDPARCGAQGVGRAKSLPCQGLAQGTRWSCRAYLRPQAANVCQHNLATMCPTSSVFCLSQQPCSNGSHVPPCRWAPPQASDLNKEQQHGEPAGESSCTVIVQALQCSHKRLMFAAAPVQS